MDPAGRVVVVTGAASGIGAALADAFAAAGASVVVGDLDADGAASTASAIVARGDRAVAEAADAADGEGIAALLDAAGSAFGPVDIFVANAGITGPPGIGECDDDWDRILDVNLRAHVRAARLLVPQWVQRGQGHFVAVASAAGLLTQLGAAGYSVTKHAAVAFAEWLAISYGDQGVGVSCVCPMGVDTALLAGMRDAADDDGRLAAGAVLSAGQVLSPGAVASATLDAVRDGRFLVLPHPEVLTMYRHKGADYDGWIAGMRRYQRSLRG
ncbi:SDR family oxidoreductase [Mycobacterium sp. MYCO198283]|uniref:SDR family oxidoreductase n=1 Tax=Mycobacterium sp. MYCO198283 TaxID=2883505 RepID=UPI001E408EC7|nr:SDR family oxidoreductase [Mycobacterium sp. MYCO198283]MCG5433821.1 SDR family oxidoreductase [Mycobacterium sp. MYCO198283]